MKRATSRKGQWFSLMQNNSGQKMILKGIKMLLTPEFDKRLYFFYGFCIFRV